MKHFFILGRNPELSKAELLSYLDARDRSYTVTEFKENYIILETKDGEKFNIQEFGGILKYGEITFEGNSEEFLNYIDNNELIESDKFSYGITGNIDEIPIKEKFKSERRKATLKSSKKGLKMQSGSEINLSKTDFSLFGYEKGETIYYGPVTQEYDYTDVKKRDMKKPNRREHLSISPRLSIILINLSGARVGSHLLDPFCGIGGIVAESLIKNIKTTGLDIDGKAIKDAKKNIEWLESNYKITAKYTIENLDSKKTPDMQFSAVATETPLGKVLKKKPRDSYAKKIVQDFESLIIPILKRIRSVKKRDARIAITFPRVGKTMVDYRKVAKSAGLKIALEPIEESRPDQFIARDILVLS